MRVSPQTCTGSSWTTEPQGVAAGLPSFLDLLTQIKLCWVLPANQGECFSHLLKESCFSLQGCWYGLQTDCVLTSLPGRQFSSVQFSHSVMSDSLRTHGRSTPGLPVHQQLPESTQTHVHRVGDAIQPSHPLSSPSPLAPNSSQHQGLFQ